MDSFAPLLATMTLAVVSNLPLGFWRAHTRKFSWQWFLAIHLAVPLVVALRLALALPYFSIPLLIAAAILGQVLGSQLAKRPRMPVR